MIQSIRIDPVLLLIVLLAAMPGAALGAEGDWELTLAPYLWAAGLNGDVKVRARTADVDASFADVVEQSDSLFGLQGRIEARRARWGFYFDGTYLDVEVDDVTAGPAEPSLETELALAELGAFYRLKQWNGNGAGNAVAWDLYAGARYTYLSNELGFPRLRSFEQSHDWVDPLVGTRLGVDWGQRLRTVIGGDLGGFGVGSDFTWSAMALVGYRFTLSRDLQMTLWAGYRALYQDYDKDDFEWDMLLHGPLVGIGFQF